jgi:putative FmdB family regulatory protein
MPLYDYKCNECGLEFEEIRKIIDRYNAECPKCKGSVEIIPKAKLQIFKPFINEDFDGTPILVESKAHYKQLCKKHGVYAPHVFGIGWNRSEI